jgi:biotin synthase
MSRSDDCPISREESIRLLSLESSEEIEALRRRAFDLLREKCGDGVAIRGLVEFSNMCVRNCFYCGIRRANENVHRYRLDEAEILDCARWCLRQGYGSIVLQSGERRDQKFINFVCSVLEKIKRQTRCEQLPDGLGITLCVGEQNEEDYRRFFEAGAHRYLLRIETTSEKLFSKIHPKDQTLSSRVDCLDMLKRLGFQVGTGTMIGLPGQTVEDLAADVRFLYDRDIDMIGMGPYIPHQDSPMAEVGETILPAGERLLLGLKMIAVTRLMLRDVNIAATTALQALDPRGREMGLSFGANVVMPMVTPTSVRRAYQLYDGKPAMDEMAEESRDFLIQQIEQVGSRPLFNSWGDSKHFSTRQSRSSSDNDKGE